jgi:hypothetical protein
MERVGNQGSRPDHYPRVRRAILYGSRKAFRILHLEGGDREARRRDGVCEPGRGRSLVCGMDDRNVGQVSLPKNAGTGPPSGLAARP